MTIQESILKRFKQNFRDGKQGFVNSQNIQDVIHDITGHKHETIGRSLRKLAEDGIIERKEIENKNSKVSSVWYRYIPSRNEILSQSMRTL